jgi:hypothetical protein
VTVKQREKRFGGSDAEVTRKLNEVYGSIDQSVPDPFLLVAAQLALAKTEWSVSPVSGSDQGELAGGL